MQNCLFIILILIGVGYAIFHYATWNFLWVALLTVLFVGLAGLVKLYMHDHSRKRLPATSQRVLIHIVSPVPVMMLYALLGWLHPNIRWAAFWGTCIAYLPLGSGSFWRFLHSSFFPPPPTPEEQAAGQQAAYEAIAAEKERRQYAAEKKLRELR